jgi:hypothetical protein
MADNPTTEGPVKSLRQRAPGGDIPAILFAVIAAYICLSLITNRPSSIGPLLISGLFMVCFLVPAYILYASSRDSGIFATDDDVDFRILGQVRESWKKDQVRSIETSAQGVRIVGVDGRTLRVVRYRWWNTSQVEQFARSAGLAPVTPGLTSEAEPGKAGDGGEQQQQGE